MKSTASPLPSMVTIFHRLLNVDTAISLHLYTLFQPYLPYTLLKSFEFSGDGRLLFPIIIAVLLTTTSIESLKTDSIAPSNLLLINLLIGSLFDLLLIGLIKHLIQRPRPVYNKNMFLSFAVDHWSFPSGHASRASFISTFCFFYSNQIRDILLMSPLNFDPNSMIVQHFFLHVEIWAVLTSVSRVLLGRHFVLDVVAGIVVGILEGLVVFRFLNYVNLSSWIR